MLNYSNELRKLSEESESRSIECMNYGTKTYVTPDGIKDLIPESEYNYETKAYVTPDLCPTELRS